MATRVRSRRARGKKSRASSHARAKPRPTAQKSHRAAQKKTGARPLTGNNRALYLYCISNAQPPRAPLNVEGIDAASAVEALECSGFTCWISRVSRAGFAEPLSQRMEDLDWLAPASVRHQRAVAAAARHGDVLPARFGTIFSAEASLMEDVSRRKGQLQRSFRQISGADEWGIKIFRLAAAPIAPSTEESGLDYLRRKAEETQARTQPHPLPQEIAQLAASFRRLAREVIPGRGPISQGQPGLEWQASILLPRSRRVQFQAAVAAFARAHAASWRIEITGPWPPYSFVKHG